MANQSDNVFESITQKSFILFLVFADVVLLICIAAVFFIPRHKLNQAAIIRPAITKQTSTRVAGQPVAWITLVKRSDVTNS
jgi:hypothetical protein